MSNCQLVEASCAQEDPPLKIHTEKVVFLLFFTRPANDSYHRINAGNAIFKSGVSAQQYPHLKIHTEKVGFLVFLAR